MLNRYAKFLGPNLQKRYGRSSTYTPAQIERTVQETGLPQSHLWYGYAMFVEEAEFEAVRQSSGRDCDYKGMRQEIADLCLSGDRYFVVSNQSLGDYVNTPGGLGFGGVDGGVGGCGGGND